tara:strand:+ start:275 stop:598 length:324 start_codon:yes stop_codon:yes gene_type:complete
MNNRKQRWIQVGTLWMDGGWAVAEVKMSGVISLGILGEVSVIIRKNDYASAGKPRYKVLMSVDKSPLNILANLGGSRRGQDSAPPLDDGDYAPLPEEEDDIPFGRGR